MIGVWSPTWRPRGLSKWVISRVISTLNGVTLITTLIITDLLSPLGLQVLALWRARKFSSPTKPSLQASISTLKFEPLKSSQNSLPFLSGPIERDHNKEP